jgi:hypothetical protein
MAAAPGASDATAPANRFTVDVREDGGWSVAIVDPDGADAFVRACRDEAEARTFASTVRQHVGWLSEERFREIYRLGTS